MTRPGLRASGKAGEDSELLAQLGLPTSASPEDVDELHQAVSQYLTTAPSEIRGWARAQVAALDEAYLHLTDPVGFGGSALRSPARPPAVVLGGPATPPARRGSVPAVDMSPEPEIEGWPDEIDGDVDEIDGEPDAEDLAALYAMVTPSVHADMIPDARRPERAAPATVRVAAPVVRRRHRGAAAAPMAIPAQAGPNPWKRLFLGTVGIVAVAVIGYGVINFVGGTGSDNGAIAQATPQPVATAPAVDTAKIADLMAKLQANPNDTEALLALADEYYAGQQFAEAGTFLDKLLAFEPEHIQALLARGATYFNLTDLVNAEKTWQKVVAIDPKNVEVHYDLGFLYLNQVTPDWAGVQREWNLVIELDPTSDLAKTVQSHLDSLASSSMLPDGSPTASAPASAAPSAAASASSDASPAASTTP